MPAATGKTDLLTACAREFEKLRSLVDGIDAGTALTPGEGDVTIKDVVGHRAHWIDLWLDWEEAGREGRKVEMPAPGFSWGQLRPYNAMVRDRQRDLTWTDVRNLLRDRHAALMDRLGAMTGEELYGRPMTGGNGKWTAGRYAEAAGASHYRSAARFIRKTLRAARDS